MRNLIECWSRPRGWTMPVTEAELHRVEHRLGLRFPTDYRLAVTRHGLPWISPTLRVRMLAGGLDWALEQFFSPELIAEIAIDMRASCELCEDLIPIAQAADGCLICLGDDASTYEEDECLVMSFDPVYGYVVDLCPTFDSMLELIATLNSGWLH